MATKLTLIPYLQGWDGAALHLRLLCLPRGSPLDPLQSGSNTSFATANFKFEVRILTDVDALPTPTGTAIATRLSPPLGGASTVFQALAAQFPIDPTPPSGVTKPPNSKVKKHLPLTYQSTVGYAGTNSDICFTDDTYTCMMGQSRATYQKLPPPNPKWAWGRVMAVVLRNPSLAIATGLVRPLSVQLPDPAAFKYGGYVYLTLAPNSDGFGLLSITEGLKVYASRVPPLGGARELFSPVFFRVADAPPTIDYSAVFAEAQDYDDGWTKAVHCSQVQQLDHMQEGSDDPRPVKEQGIRIGWDDEQVAVWMNRQLDDTQVFDSPLGVQGYRLDASLQGTNQWHSLVRAKGPIPLPGATVSPFDGELSVEVSPVQQFAQKQGDFWLPMYFTAWTGPALVTTDETMLRLMGDIDLSAKQKIRGQAPDLSLVYGQTYSFRVRLADHTSGGPSITGSPIHPGPSPTASLPFRRWVRPMAPLLVSPSPSSFGSVPNPENPPTSLEFQRPRLTYPAVVCTGAYSNTIDLLIADIPEASAEKREPGLFDPDIVAVRITVEVAGFAQDPLATDAGYMPIYQTSKSFPADTAASLRLAIDWKPCNQLGDFVPDQTLTGPLTLPEARSIRLRIASECKADPNLDYFGKDDVRHSPSVQLEVRKHSSSEPGLFQSQSPSRAINAFFFQPDAPVDSTMIAAQKTAGNAQRAPSDLASRAANAFGLPNNGFTFFGAFGRRTVFACGGALLNIISPDLASITLSSQTDLALHWIIVIRMTINRDWTWDGLAYNGINVQRDGVDVASFSPSQNIDKKILDGADRSGSDLIFFDTIDPKPATDQFPQELNPVYRITTTLIGAATTDPPQQLTIRLPITTSPTQTPKLVSAGIAMSPYIRATDYSTTVERQRALWLEFDQPPTDPNDQYYARVLFNAPDPLLTLKPAFPLDTPILEPPFPVDSELVRRIVPGEATDLAGLETMQMLIPADPDPTLPSGTVQYLIPLPPGTIPTSPSLFGFWTYELRVGHGKQVWSTARGRFGPPLRVAGVKHPPPPLICSAARTKDNILVSAPIATAAAGDVLIPGNTTSLWALLYAQVTLIDGSDRSNVLLARRQMSVTAHITHGESKIAAPLSSRAIEIPALNTSPYAQVSVSMTDVNTALATFRLSTDAGLSVLAVELLPPAPAGDPLGADLGTQRILRASPLVAVPAIC